MRDADARDHRQVAEGDRRAGEAVDESNPGAEENRRDVDVDLVEEPGVQQLLEGVGAVDPDVRDQVRRAVVRPRTGSFRSSPTSDCDGARGLPPWNRQSP
jgi:hypothetical protein